MIFALALMGVGTLFSWLAILGWRHRKEESISLLEAGILKVTGAEPLPVTRFDRWLQRFQIVMVAILGPLLLLVGSYGLLSEMGML